MKSIRRILSTLPLLVLLLNIILPVSATESDTDKLNMTASATSVSHGDNVTVTVASNVAFTTKGAGMTVSYDPEALEPVILDSTVKEGFRISGPMNVNGQTVLRISSFPGEEGRTVEVDEPLAVLVFHTLTPGDNIRVEMTAAYLYDEALNQIELQKAEPVQLSVAPVSVTGITIERETLDLEIGESITLKATILPENASDKTVSWTSSDETKVTVEDGVLTGLEITEEPVTITASIAGFTAECTVNVVTPPDAGYTVTMPADNTAVVGEIIAVSPVIKNGKEITDYNAYDMTFYYDPSILEFVESTDGPTVTVTDGKVTLLHYGEDQSVNTSPFTLSFRVIAAGKATITLENSRIDHSQNAIIQNAAKAYCAYPTMTVTVQGYSVTLPSDFTGDPVAVSGADYTFKAVDKCYDYIFTGSTMGGKPVEVQDNGNGTYTVKNVSGTLIISVPENGKTEKTFEVLLGEGMTGESHAQYMTDYSAVLNEDDQYNYIVRVTIGGNNYNGYYKSGDTYTIPGKDITGNIIFTVTKTPVPSSTVYHKVTFQGSGAGAAGENATKVANGKTYSFTLNQEEGYVYNVTYQMGSKDPVPIWPNAEGKYSVANVTNTLVITIEKQQEQPHDRVEVTEYITLRNSKTMYLVLVNETPEPGQYYTYNGNTMYYSWVYHAWCILTPETEVLTAEIAETKLMVQSGEMTAIGSAACDVNMTGLVDINDAQLAYDLYNGKYEDFTIINMHRFLNADVNVDRKITVADAAAVANEIK